MPENTNAEHGKSPRAEQYERTVGCGSEDRGKLGEAASGKGGGEDQKEISTVARMEYDLTGFGVEVRNANTNGSESEAQKCRTVTRPIFLGLASGFAGE